MPKKDSIRKDRTVKNKHRIIRAYKEERGCRNCTERDYRALDLHHIDPSTKHPSLRKGRKLYHLSYDDMFLEFEKCIVLCANCHRKETYTWRRVDGDCT